MFSIRKINNPYYGNCENHKTRYIYGELGRYFKFHNNTLICKGTSDNKKQLQLDEKKIFEIMYSSNNGLTIVYTTKKLAEYITFDGEVHSIQDSWYWTSALVDSTGGVYYTFSHKLLYKRNIPQIGLCCECIVLRKVDKIVGLNEDDQLYVHSSNMLYLIKYGIIDKQLKENLENTNIYLLRNGDILYSNSLDKIHFITKDLKINETSLSIKPYSGVALKRNSFIIKGKDYYAVEYNDWSPSIHYCFSNKERRVIKSLFTFWYFHFPFNKIPKDMIFLICKYIMSFNE